MDFEIIGPIRCAETFAYGSGIRELIRLKKTYGTGRWRKRKGIATIKTEGGHIYDAEIHWYEASGLGKYEFKIKRYLS